MQADELKRKYAMGVLWSMVYEDSDDPKIKEQMVKVIEKIGQLEEALNAAGIPNEWKEEVIKRSRRLTEKTVGEMNDQELEAVTKVIFGQNTKLEKLDPRDLRRPGSIVIDPTRARYTPPAQPAPDEIKYVTYEHKKPLWMGTKVSIRSYVVEQALANGTGIKVKHEGQTMTLTPERLKNEGIHNRENRHKAQSSAAGIEKGDEYYLIDYVFKPDK